MGTQRRRQNIYWLMIFKKHFWAKAANTAVYLRNRSATACIETNQIYRQNI